ncbi:MAG: sugar kinase [Bdellovibrionaceae bacterium]|nr:sugar kinase [Pseudobdellovibrionaceae bacterium]
MSEILVVGSLAYDSIKTPSGSAPRALGGSANYFSLAASLFSKVRVVGVVGDDYSSTDRELLQKRGVDLSGMIVQPGKTFHWEGAYEGDMNEAITLKTELNVFETFDPVLPAHYKDSKFVFLANISPDLQGKVLDQCEKPLLVGMDTMNFWISSKLDDLKKTLKRVDIALINEGEAMMLTGAGNAIEAAPRVCELGPKALVIKRGEYGFVLYTKDEGFFILPAFPITKVIDPTGAGDTFAGAFFGYLASLGRAPTTADLKQACVRGTVVASFTIQDFSVKALADVTPAKVEDRYKSYRQVVHLA